jgi:hypothetical protein
MVDAIVGQAVSQSLAGLARKFGKLRRLADFRSTGPVSESSEIRID